VNPTPPEHIEKMDWRINNLTWTTAPTPIPGTDQFIKPGAVLMQAGTIYHGKLKATVKIPNATALFLGLSQQYHVEAVHWAKRWGENRDKASYENLLNIDEFTFYERIMASVVFAHTALEAFVNEEIPDTYIYDEAGNKCTRQFSKEQIERELSLDTKLGEVLPKALKVSSPKGGTLWNKYTDLQKLRDRVVHMKTKDKDFLGSDPNSIWNGLLSDPLPETYKTAKAMMKYFLDAKNEHPRWFEKCPF
jgi:hypothetical protein